MCGESICIACAGNGDLEMLQFVYENGGTLSVHTNNQAALNGHIHVIIWCRSQGCPWNFETCFSAARQEHIYVLKWLRSIGRDECSLYSDETEICPWNESICANAIACKNVNVLRFALENGCECSSDSRLAAMNSSNVKIRKLVMDHFL